MTAIPVTKLLEEFTPEIWGYVRAIHAGAQIAYDLSNPIGCERTFSEWLAAAKNVTQISGHPHVWDQTFEWCKSAIEGRSLRKLSELNLDSQHAVRLAHDIMIELME